MIEQLRNKYPIFIYDSYNIIEENNTLHIEYNYEIKNLSKFTHKISINFPNAIQRSYSNYKEEINNIVFNLGIMEAISYLKMTCSNKFVINCGYLDNKQVNWYKNIFYQGLGEFIYLNNITIEQADLFNFELNVKKKFIKTNKTYENKGFLIPVGGGKDSIVSMELLKDYNPIYFVVNPNKTTLACIDKTSNNTNKVIVTRTLDKKFLELTPNYLNGHIPITGILSFITYLTSFMIKNKYIAFSNEASANEATVVGTNINHQYSKSISFEKDFKEYVECYLPYNIEYFSLLRGLDEIQITKLFSNYKKYHDVFISCNKGIRSSNWCGTCPKCLFVYIMLRAFLAEEELIKIFGKNLLDDEKLLTTFIELIGKSTTKPFECVGTIDEVRLAVDIIINNSNELPYLLRYYKDNYSDIKVDYNLLTKYNNDNYIPKELNELIKGVYYDK